MILYDPIENLRIRQKNIQMEHKIRRNMFEPHINGE